jgi:hypothetical protein
MARRIGVIGPQASRSRITPPDLMAKAGNAPRSVAAFENK